MLPRQATNSHKYEVKRKNSIDEEKPKLIGISEIQQRQEASKLARPQTAAPSKIAKPKARSNIPEISGSKLQSRTKAKTEAEPKVAPSSVGGDRIKNLLKNNPHGAAAVLKRETDGISGTKPTPHIPLDSIKDNGQSDAAKKLDQSIKNAYKLRMNQFEDAQANDIGISNPKPTIQSIQSASKPMMHNMQSPKPPIGDSEDFTTTASLEDLKVQHERLVDKILKEEDDLISNHHKSINKTINSVKEQEQLRHNVDLPGSDVEEYILSLDNILAERLAEAEHLRRTIQEFHKHIRQEQAISQRFYQMQEAEQADIAADY